MSYTQINYIPGLSVGASPDITVEWCGYNPDKYKFDAFIHGIAIDLFHGEITKLRKTMPAGHAFYLDALDPESVIGDVFRHIEYGQNFIKDYQEVQKPGEPLGPVSAYPVNIITETDKQTEKWECSSSYNLFEFVEYFRNYAGFLELMQRIQGNIKGAVQDAISLIIKAIISSNPLKVVIDDKDFARIFGKTKLHSGVAGQPTQEEAQAYIALMRKKIEKYASKAATLWKNVQFYNPYHYTYDNQHEEPRKDFYFEGVKPGQDIAKVFEQEIYTVAHNDEGEESETTKHIANLRRVDCLFAMLDTISTAINIMFHEKSAEFWAGNDTGVTIYDTKAAKERAKKAQAGAGLDGHAADGRGQQDGTIVDTKATSKNDDSFEVQTEPQYLAIHLNPEDYAALKAGIARHGPITESKKLSDLGDLNIFPERSISPGFIRFVDKRALVIKPYFEMFDLAPPKEKLHYRHKYFWQMNLAIFKNFVGCLFLPTPHFIASPRFYLRHGLIGQEIEKKKGG